VSVGEGGDFPLTSPVPWAHPQNWFLKGYLKCQFVGLGISQARQLISMGGGQFLFTSLPVLPPRPLSTSALPNPTSPLESDCSPADLIQTPQTSSSSRSQKHQQWTEVLQLPAAMLAFSLLVLGLLAEVAPASCQQGSTGQGYLGFREERGGRKTVTEVGWGGVLEGEYTPRGHSPLT
jgi:hypothetical protein